MCFVWAKPHGEPRKHLGRSLPQQGSFRYVSPSLDELYSSTDVPQNIEDLHTTVARINVPNSFNVEDVDVGVTISHPWVRDLTLWLERDSVFIDTVFVRRDTFWVDDTTWRWDTTWSYVPDTTVAQALLLDLFPGDSIVNLTDTWFDDDAGVGIYDGLPPFTGGFRPLRSVDALFAGHDAQGEWRLLVRDRFLIDEGVLEAFRLEINGIVSLRGTVTNSVNGNPVSGAVVSVIDTALSDTLARTTTLSNGTYNLSRIAPGSYRVTASASNYDPAFVDGVTITEGQSVTQNFTLTANFDYLEFPYAGAPVPIPDLSQIIVPLEVTGSPGVVQDLDVTVTITHPYIADMFLAVKPPVGDSVVLFNPPLTPSLGADMTDCRFDDEAATPIEDGTGPFTGRFSPVDSLKELDGTQIVGTWHMIAEDAGAADEGTFQSFILHFEAALPIDEGRPDAPESFALHPAFPNPFNASVTLLLDVVRQQDIRLEVFDVTGRLVETLHSGVLNAGSHRFVWSPLRAASGVYFVRAGGSEVSRITKVVLLK